MTNIEKYTNTKDALEAYNSLVFKRVSFDVWLECEYEDQIFPTLLEAAEGALKSFEERDQYGDLELVKDRMRQLSVAVEREKAKPVLNFEKYKTNDEAFVAYTKMCDSRECKIFHFRYCGNSIKCVLAWLYAEAEKEEAEAEKEEADE